MRLVKLTRVSGEVIHVNPDHVMRVYWYESSVRKGTSVTYAVLGGNASGHSPEREIVREPVELVVKLLEGGVP